MIHSFTELRERAGAVRPQTVAVACAHDAHTLEAVLHAAQEGILRRYAGANSAQIEAAKVGICCNGYQAQVYGRAAAGEVSWLLAQAKSHAAAPDDRRLLEPLAELAAKKRTPREISGCV